MSKRFLLFGERSFDDYAREQSRKVSSKIQQMSDFEILDFEHRFYELIRNTLRSNAIKNPEILFQHKVVDIENSLSAEPSLIAEYFILVSGDKKMLEFSPFNSGYRPVDLHTELTGNVISFKIDTRHLSKTDEVEPMHLLNIEYDRVIRFIGNTLESLHRSIDQFNRELEKHVICLLSEKLHKAVEKKKIIRYPHNG